MDETYVGSEEAGLDGRGALKKALIVVAAEQEAAMGLAAFACGYGNAYMRLVATVTFLSLIPLLLQTIGTSTSAVAAPVLTLAAGILSSRTSPSARLNASLRRLPAAGASFGLLTTGSEGAARPTRLT